jgi:hypothetical protein
MLMMSDTKRKEQVDNLIRDLRFEVLTVVLGCDAL